MNAMNLGMSEMIFIFLLALVVMGPKKLPELGRQLGKFLAEFKRASNEFKHQIEAEMINIELQERAKKKQENLQVLPPEEPWERVMLPVSDTISRAGRELVSVTGSKAEPVPPIAPNDPAAASATSPDNA